MLSSKARLDTYQVDALNKRGRRYSTKNFFIVYSSTTSNSKFGVAAPKSGGITAVARNRLRRVVYAHLGGSIVPKLTAPTEALIGARKGAYNLTTTDIRQEITTLFEGARLMP